MRVWVVERERVVRVWVVERGPAVKESIVGVRGLGELSLWRVGPEGN